MKNNQHFPVAIALTETHGWQAIYETTQCRGITFETVFWLRKPSEELGVMVEACLKPNSNCLQMQNLLIPDIYRTIRKIDISYDLSKIKQRVNKVNTQ
ncbi:MAG TPA: hypothetical protein DF712_14710 [Balneola sp.]|nr:hypothetical protein [Balneola sp.]|tara:strand:- start:389 stop:682 length:294 start_codon:yes stop_codon:yes gene_type:complete